MTHNDKDRDEAVEKELDGVPEEFLNDSDGSDEDTVEEETNRLDEALDRLREDLDAAKQEVLYSKAETQNVRRRMEKDITDARNYAATGFARDILSVADNLSRAIEAVPEDLREDSKFKGLVAGIQATQREMEKAFEQHGITPVSYTHLTLPTSDLV